MRTFCLTLALTLCAFLGVAVATQTPAFPSDAAMKMAHVVGLPTLINLTRLGIHNTVTYKMLVTSMGAEAAEQFVASAMKAHIAQYAPQWEAVNAAAYTRILTADEMNDLASGSPSPANQEKFFKIRSDAGNYIKQNGANIVRDYVASVLMDGLKASEQAAKQSSDSHKSP